ncbi:MAG: phage portal protein [Rhodobacteraceae bacterium]|nr:phage portal protein [Paracoccaceae bacterium]
MKLFGFELTRGDATPAAARIEPQITASEEPSGTANPAPWFSEIGWGGGKPNRYLPRISPERSEKHATVFACCNNIAGDLAKVPLKLYQRDGQGQDVRVREHPANYLLNVEASPGVPAAVARFGLIYPWALRGNSFAYAPRDGGGELELVEIILEGKCTPLKAGRARFYDIEDGAGIQRRVPSRSMAHLRYLALDGWTGRSPLQVASESMGLAMKGQETAARSLSGAHAKAFVKMADHYESDVDRKRNERRIKTQLTSPDADGLPIIGPEDDIKSLDLTAADQELLGNRKFDREMIAAIYRMPPSKLQMLEYGVKANGEQQAIDYLTDCLFHWSVLAEGQCAMAFLTRAEREAGLFLRHDFGALLQPTIKDQIEAVTKAVGGPIYTPDEGRQKMGLGKIDGGEKLNPAPNMTRNEPDKKKGKDE